MILQIVHISLLVAAVLVSIPLTILAGECMAAQLPGRRRKPTGATIDPRVDVLVPAHDEADGIVATIASILPQLGPNDRLWVVADNCLDATAELARQAHAQVLERHSVDQRGKGFALNFGINHLANDPPDVLVLIDADCQLAPGAIGVLTTRALTTGRPIQCAYLMHAQSDAGPQALVSECAVMIKNFARPLGLTRLGLPCLLTGSGIALPWDIARQVEFCGNSIVEDMQLSVDLLRARHRPLFEPAAQIVASLPAKQDAAVSQRRRWEHGHLQVLCNQVPRLLWSAVGEFRWDLLVAALDIAVPPLSLLGALWGAMLLLAAVVGVATGYWLAAIVLAATGSIAAIAVALAVWRFSPGSMWGRVMLSVPGYALGKLSLYASFPFARQTSWNRTSRDLPAGNRLDGAIPGPAVVPHPALVKDSLPESVQSVQAEIQMPHGDRVSVPSL